MSREPDFVSVNGQLISKSKLTVSADDRGFCYGDGLFDTALIFNQIPTFLDWRKQRLRQGLEFLEFEKNWTHSFLKADLEKQVRVLISANQLSDQPGVMKLVVTRGTGPRGYGIPPNSEPWVLIQAYSTLESKESLKRRILGTSIKLGIHPRPVADNDPYRQHKLLNKVPSILARSYANQQGWDDALLMDRQERLLESSSGNLFWLENGVLWTPPLGLGVLDGITRRWVIEIVGKSGVLIKTGTPTRERLLCSQGIALTSSIQGWVNVREFEGRSFSKPDLFREIQEMYLSDIESHRSEKPVNT